MSFIPDTYTRRGRLYPALLIALPLGLATLVWFPDGVTGWATFWGLIVWSGGTALIAQIGRDWGRNKQAQLFRLWGGKPTTRMLRHRDAPNKVTLERRHNKLQQLLPELNMPTLEEEQSEPERADEIYDAGITFLREQTRDKEKFHLVFEENCNYGFRRNLWGMKTLGIISAAVGTLAVIVHLWVNGISTPPLAVIIGAVNSLFLLGWWLWITPDWVRTAGEAYAERLLEASEELSKKDNSSNSEEEAVIQHGLH